MTRLPDWRSRLMRAAAEAAHQPIAYGQHDCFLFALDAVDAMCGTAWAAECRGRYTTLREGLVAGRRAGFADHVAFIAARLPEIAPALARVGDLAVTMGTDGLAALGVVQGAGIYVLHPGGGLGTVPLTLAVGAFRV